MNLKINKIALLFIENYNKHALFFLKIFLNLNDELVSAENKKYFAQFLF
jgi:hypothetical protein